MAQLTVQNLTNNPVYIRDLYATIQPNGSITTTRYASDLPRMAGLQAAIAAGQVAASLQLSDAELASGLVGQGLAQVPPSTASPEEVVRVQLTPGAGGGADDVQVYAFNELPGVKLRIISAYADISTAEAGSTLQVRSAPVGGGSLCAQMSSAVVGRAAQDNTVTSSVVLVNGPTVGLWVHRSNNLVEGEVFITLRPEV
jgi:hypothetical protein